MNQQEAETQPIPDFTLGDVTAHAQKKLLEKLAAWLIQQPEWPMLFLANRKDRRRTSQEVAKMLYTLPRRG